MLTGLKDGQVGHWRQRLAMADELMEALQTGQVVDCPPPVRELLMALGADEKWEVRKAIANGLSLVEDEVFDDLAAKLIADANGFVRSAAERSYALRRERRREVRKKDSAERSLARQLSRLREKCGDEGIQQVFEASEARFNLLAGSMAHDLRSILTHLQPAARAMLAGIDDDSDRTVLKRKADRVVEGLTIMERCVADMELYTEPLPVDRHPENLAEVLNVACEMARKNIEELGFDSHMVVLHQEVPDGLRIRLSRHLIILAVSNLVKNAYESFMERHKHLRRGEIFIEASIQADVLEIVIRDTGMGMSPDNLAELCAMVPRRRNKAKRKSTGFGVPIAHRYVEAHGGAITFESTEDVGTTATITLPKAQSFGEDVL